MDLALAAAASSASAMASTSMSDSAAAAASAPTASPSPAAGLGSLLKTKDGKFSMRKLSGLVKAQVKATKVLKSFVPVRRASVAEDEWLANRNEEQFVACTGHLTLRNRAQLRPLKPVLQRHVQPEWYGEIFSLHSSFGNADCFSIGPKFKPGAYKHTNDALLKHTKREVQRNLACKQAEEQLVPHDILVYDDTDGKVPTQWHGVRTRSDEACSYRCNGRAFPVDYIPPKPRRHAHDLKPKRPAPLNRASYPSASIPDANCDPKQYGALRLANSPTASSIRAVRNRYEDELHKHKRSRANLGRLMFADMNQALVYDME